MLFRSQVTGYNHMANTLYEYYKAQGKTLPSWNSPERMALAQQAGISGYTGTAEQNNAILAKLQGGQSPSSIGTQQTPGISGGLAPVVGGSTGGTQQQPQPGQNLTTFKDTAAEVMNLARQKRNDNMRQFMMGEGAAGAMGIPSFKGTMMASDFNSLFNQMNTTGDQYGEMVAEKLIKTQPTWKQEQIGSDLYQYQVDGAGRIIGTPEKVLGGTSTSSKFSPSEIKKLRGAGYTEEQINQLASDASDSERGVEWAWDNELDPTKKTLIEDIFDYAPKYITEEWLRKQFKDNDALEDAAWDGGYHQGGFLGSGVGKSGTDAYIKSLIARVEGYRAKGMTDKEIEKEMFED
jgi:hypothetical protein